MRLVPTRALQLAVALSLTTSLAACAAHPGSPGESIAKTATTMAPEQAMGRVTLDLNGVFGRAPGGEARQTLAYGLDPALYAIAKIRLTLQYPGLEGAPITLATVDWNTSAAAQDANAPLPSAGISATVEAGYNRVFTVEALDADSRVLMRMRAATQVPASGSVALKLNFVENTVAQVIENLIAADRPMPEMGPTEYRIAQVYTSPPAFDKLRNSDLAGNLRQYVTTLTGFNVVAPNTYTRLAPQLVNVERLTNALFSEMYNGGGVEGLPTSADNQDLSYFEGSTRSHSLSLTELRTDRDVLNSGEEIYTYTPSDAQQYKVTVIAPFMTSAPISTTWLPQDRVPFEAGSVDFTTAALPPGRYTVVLHRTVGATETRIYRDIIIGVESAYTVPQVWHQPFYFIPS